MPTRKCSKQRHCILPTYCKKSTWITVLSFLSWPNHQCLSGLCRACKIAIKAAMSNRFAASSRFELGDFNVFLSTKVFLFHLSSFITIDSQEIGKSKHSWVHSQLVQIRIEEVETIAYAEPWALNIVPIFKSFFLIFLKIIHIHNVYLSSLPSTPSPQLTLMPPAHLSPNFVALFITQWI